MDSRDKTTDSIVVTIEIDELSRSSDLATEYFGGGGDGTGELLVRRFLQLVGASLYAFEDEYPPVQTLKVVVAAFDGVADTSGTKTDKTLRLSASYFTHARHTDLDHELHGVIVHELVHVLQYDGSIDAGATANGGFIEGLADYVRITAGLAPGHWRPESQPPASNDKWDRGYEHTAYFLRWVDRNSPSNTASNTSSTGNVSNTAATFKLNLLLRDLVWDDALFEIVAGAPVNQLWRGYLASFIDAETKAADANVLANDHAVFTADLRSLLSIAESQKDPLFLGRMRASIARPLREYLLLFNSDDEIVRRGYEK
ncbi:hypothetical protein HK100_010693 [Physocladia obscura]|uniref:Plant Basic Secretory Protein n=1 Tax=Physocladia obscura TaxID=109957 RepID=A0AAD5TAS4_9FUNG|nr:hypothetical protein HK100_010693 [Physocladia obscura]